MAMSRTTKIQKKAEFHNTDFSKIDYNEKQKNFATSYLQAKLSKLYETPIPI